jgi:hypothetical protein
MTPKKAFQAVCLILVVATHSFANKTKFPFILVMVQMVQYWISLAPHLGHFPRYDAGHNYFYQMDKLFVVHGEKSSELQTSYGYRGW